MKKWVKIAIETLLLLIVGIGVLVLLVFTHTIMLFRVPRTQQIIVSRLLSDHLRWRSTRDIGAETALPFAYIRDARIRLYKKGFLEVRYSDKVYHITENGKTDEQLMILALLRESTATLTFTAVRLVEFRPSAKLLRNNPLT